jgi:hemerythrin
MDRSEALPMQIPMQWSDQFLLGYPAMDATHAEFVACVAALQTAEDAQLVDCLEAFAAHAVAHFAQEEGWMQTTGFPAAQCHMDEHAAVLASVREVQCLLADADNGPGRFRIVRDLTAALVRWFPGHADYLDAALSHWMSKRAHGGAPVVLRRGVAHTTEPGTAHDTEESAIR